MAKKKLLPPIGCGTPEESLAQTEEMTRECGWLLEGVDPLSTDGIKDKLEFWRRCVLFTQREFILNALYGGDTRDAAVAIVRDWYARLARTIPPAVAKQAEQRVRHARANPVIEKRNDELMQLAAARRGQYEGQLKAWKVTLKDMIKLSSALGAPLGSDRCARVLRPIWPRPKQ